MSLTGSADPNSTNPHFFSLRSENQYVDSGMLSSSKRNRAAAEAVSSLRMEKNSKSNRWVFVSLFVLSFGGNATAGKKIRKNYVPALDPVINVK